MNPLQNPPEVAYSLVTHLVRIALIGLGAVIAIRIVSALVKPIERAIREDPHGDQVAREKRARTVGDVMRRAARGILIVVALLMVVREFGFDITPTLAAAGGFGVAAGLGAQQLVRDLVAGFLIIRHNQIAVGDVVRVAGLSGTVESISLRLCEIRDGEGAVHYVPCGEIKYVTNLSKTWASPLVRIPVSLTEDPVRAIEEMKSMLTEFREDPAVRPFLLDTPRVLGVDDVTTGQFTVLLQARTVAEQRWLVTRELRLAAINRLRRAGMALHTAAGTDGGQPGGPSGGGIPA